MSVLLNVFLPLIWSKTQNLVHNPCGHDGLWHSVTILNHSIITHVGLTCFNDLKLLNSDRYFILCIQCPRYHRCIIYEHTWVWTVYLWWKNNINDNINYYIIIRLGSILIILVHKLDFHNEKLLLSVVNKYSNPLNCVGSQLIYVLYCNTCSPNTNHYIFLYISRKIIITRRFPASLRLFEINYVFLKINLINCD